MEKYSNEYVIELLGDKFRSTKYNERDDIDDFSIFNEVKIIGLYFATNMSAMSRAYTRALRILYDEINKDIKTLEVVLISSENYDQLNENMSRMKWFVKEQDDKEIRELKKTFKAYEVPKLVLINKEGNTLCKSVKIDQLNKNYFQRWILKTNHIIPNNSTYKHK